MLFTSVITGFIDVADRFEISRQHNVQLAMAHLCCEVLA